MADKTDQELIVDEYEDGGIKEYANTPVPTFLKYVYVILPIWGVVWWMLYWDGSQGFLDRGYWSQLANAANTRWEKVAENPPVKTQNPQR